MAYVTQYTANFKNELNQNILVSIAKKDGSTVQIINYPVISLKISDNSDEQDIYATIITKQLDLVIWTEQNNDITWETFINSSHKDWKITVADDSGNLYFIGFITPDEGDAPFQDKPYEINIKATDGIGLLKGFDLSKTDSTDFRGFYKLTDYLSAALYKTGLDLNLRIISTYSHSDLPNKNDSLNNDIFNLMYLNWRTFLKTSDTYESCYDTLKKLLGGWCNLQQYNGKWQIITLSDRQYTSASLYYVDYDTTGSVINSNILSESSAQVGKDELIYPINESQRIKSKFSIRESKYIFTYNQLQDLINNSNLSKLGNVEGSGNTTDPSTGAVNGTYKNYTLPYWTQYNGQVYPQYQTSSTKTPVIRVESDLLNNQTDRYIEVRQDSTAPSTILHTFIKNDNTDFYVQAGDYINVSITFRTKSNENYKNILMGTLAILKDGTTGTSTGDWYSLDDSSGVYSFLNNPNATFCKFVQSQTSTTEWKTISVDNLKVPASGQIFLYLGCGALLNGNASHFKDIKIDYIPTFLGSKFNIKGDYHFNSQNLDIPDKFEKEISLSDSPKRAIKGSLFWKNNTNTMLTLQQKFYPYPNNQLQYNFKQLINLGYYNQNYRRFYKIEGDFTSLVYNTADDQSIKNPLGFHKKYKFTDMSPQREFVLEPSLEMDMVTGNIKATFVEVYKDENDGLSTGDVDKFDYIF